MALEEGVLVESFSASAVQIFDQELGRLEAGTAVAKVDRVVLSGELVEL